MKPSATNWDRTNIGENYPGITLPLTYSFVKHAYSRVYRNFLRLIGVSAKKIDGNRTALNNMLGYVRGHICYNIDNWYVFLQFMPGYRYNAHFFEAMLDPVKKNQAKNRIIFLSHRESLFIATKFFLSLLGFHHLHRKFETRFERLMYHFNKYALRELDAFSLVTLFETIEEDFFKIWAITIINDFKVMIFFGLLTKTARKHPKEAQVILKQIYDLKNQPRSLLPLKEIVRLSTLIKKNHTYMKLFDQDADTIWANMQQASFRPLYGVIKNYLHSYGERSSNELKLEVAKFRDNPVSFISLLKNYVQLNRFDEQILNGQAKSANRRDIPKTYSIWERICLRFFRAIASKGIYQREYYRMKRGQTFAIARKVFLEIGRRLHESGDLDEINDVFYLYKQELFDYIRHHSLPSQFKSIVNYRKKIIESYELESLPRRMTTYGFPNENVVVHHDSPVKKQYSGQPTSQGKVRGEVVVMERLDFEADYKDKILVTTATDPGWTVIFPLLRGVITEHGGTLSHASIITRELGIPCIVKVTDATKLFKNGMNIQMDATTGMITIID